MSYQQKSSGANRYLEWWYRLTSPPEAAVDASLSERERARRGRLSSIILFVMLVFLFASSVGALIQPDHHLLFVLLPSFLISIVVLVLNRLGKVTTAGIVLVLGFELGYIFGLLRTPGGLGVRDLPRFDLLVETILLAVSFLPARVVPWIAVGNCIFIWAALTFLPRTGDLNSLLSMQAYSVIETPIALQVIVAFVTYLWVRSTNQAIARADRAEVVASLQQTIAQQKQQLDEGVQQILQTHVQVANGNFQARAPLTQDNSLWQIAVSLNNLLARLQRLGDSERELQQTRYEIRVAKDALAQSRQEAARLSEILQKTRQKEASKEKIPTQPLPTQPIARENVDTEPRLPTQPIARENVDMEPRWSISHREEDSSSLREPTRRAKPFRKWRVDGS